MEPSYFEVSSDEDVINSSVPAGRGKVWRKEEDGDE